MHHLLFQGAANATCKPKNQSHMHHKETETQPTSKQKNTIQHHTKKKTDSIRVITALHKQEKNHDQPSKTIIIQAKQCSKIQYPNIPPKYQNIISHPNKLQLTVFNLQYFH